MSCVRNINFSRSAKNNNRCSVVEQLPFRPLGFSVSSGNAISTLLIQASLQQLGVPVDGTNVVHEQLKLLLSLGADLNIIDVTKTEQSLLTLVPHEACIQTLLDYGLDIHQMEVVAEKKLPRYFALLESKMPRKWLFAKISKY